MRLAALADSFARPGRGPLIAAFVAFLAAMPGLFTLPSTDRDESRFAEASAQMLESGDFTMIMFQDEPRFKKPIGIYWLQALSVKAFSGASRRAIFAYRIPSLAGAMLAAAAAAWGAEAFLAPWAAALAGVLLATTTVLGVEANIATTDGALCGVVTLSMAALGRLYLTARGGPAAGWRTSLLFWLGLGASILLKGPIGPMVAGLTIVTLCVWDRRAAWLKSLGWSWGLILLAGIVLPWALAITVATDGGFWGMSVGGDLAPKLFGGQEGHGAPPGYFAVLSVVLLFPAILLAPAALADGWKGRDHPAMRFALAWLVPSWIVFELVPTKLPHYTLPTYGAIAWLAAAALSGSIGPRARWIGLGLCAIGAAAMAGFALFAAGAFGDATSWVFAVLAAALYLGAAAVGGRLLLRGRAVSAAAGACALALVGHSVVVGALAPSLKPLWLSQRLADALTRAGLNPRQGLIPGPVTIAGYGEPSAVLALGTTTELGWPADAAKALAQGRPAVVEAAEQASFQSALKQSGVQPRVAGVVQGLDYSTGQHQILTLYAPAGAPPRPAP